MYQFILLNPRKFNKWNSIQNLKCGEVEEIKAIFEKDPIPGGACDGF